MTFFRTTFAAFAFMTGAAPLFAADDPMTQRNPEPFSVHADKLLSVRPISPLIYGNFIELGLGRQSDGMRAQMLFNSSFEDIPPFKPAFFDPGCLDHGPEGYGPSADYWHSGYEQAEWYSYSSSGKGPVKRNAYGGFFHGKIGAEAASRDKGLWGIAQDGVYVKAGVDYRFCGYLGCQSRKVTVKLVAENDPAKVIAAAACAIDRQFTECSSILADRDYTGRASFRIEADQPGTLLADGLELWSGDSTDGWRNDCLALLRKVKPTVIRYPGGCFASFYDWRTGVGKHADRMPLPSEYWGGLEPNDLGTDEFLDLCKMIDAEPQMVVNMLTGTPQLAADWVEYCNGAATTPMGKRRAANGRPDPRRVTWWEMDNEAYRKFSPQQYARKVAEYAAAMRAVDPNIKLIIVGYGPMFTELPRMLEICGKDVDAVSDRNLDERAIRRNIAVLADYREKTGKRIGLCNTEWGPGTDMPPGAVEAAEVKKKNIRYQFQRWYFALNVACMYQQYWQYAEWYDLANFNDMVNTMGLDTIEASKSASWITANGRVLEFYRDSPARWPVEVAGARENLHVAAALTQDKNRIVLNIVNTGPAATVGVKVGDRWKLANVRAIAAPTLTCTNTEEHPDTVSSADVNVRISGGSAAVAMPPYCIGEITLEGR